MVNHDGEVDRGLEIDSRAIEACELNGCDANSGCAGVDEHVVALLALSNQDESLVRYATDDTASAHVDTELRATCACHTSKEVLWDARGLLPAQM